MFIDARFGKARLVLTCTPIYSRVNDIWSSWKRCLKAPREALLGAYFTNLVEAALIEDKLNEHTASGQPLPRASDTFHRRILQYLENCFANNDPVLHLLRLEHDSDLDNLEWLLKQDPVDVSAVYQILKQLRGAPTPELLKRELTKEIFRLEPADGSRLLVLTWILFRKSLERHTPRRMQNLPRSAMTRAGWEEVLARHLQSLATDETLEAQAKEVLRDSAGHVAASGRLQEHLDTSPEAMSQVFSVTQWRLETYRILEYAADLWKSEVLCHIIAAPSDDAVSSLLGDHSALNSLTESLGRRLVREVFRSALAISLGEEDATSGSRLGTLGQSLADVLIGEGAFADNGPVVRGLPEDTIRDLSSQAYAGSAAHVLADEICESYWQHSRSALLEEVAHRATELLADEAESRGVLWESATERTIEHLCRAWASRRSLDSELGVLFRPLIEDAADFLYRYSRPNLPVPRSLWEKWAWWFSKRSALYRVIPWDSFSLPEFERVLDSLFGQVLGEEDEWRAVFRVSGMDSERTSWMAGNVTFYDPYVYDYGEGWALPHNPQEFSESFARIMVRAETEESARQLALRELEGTLDMLTFARSVNRKKVGGFRPGVGRSSWVYRPSRETGLAGDQTPRADSPTIQRAVGDELAEIAKDYEHLLSLSVDPSVSATELQADFMRAAHWYRKGRWEPSAAERFLFYWIALEHLFTRRDKVRPSLESVARLRYSWRSLNALRPALNLQKRLIDKIKSHPSLCAKVSQTPELVGWDTDQRVLLNPAKVRILRMLANRSRAEDLVRNLLSELRSLAQIDSALVAEVERLREHQRYKLDLLYGLRNRLAHRAERYTPIVETYAEELEQVVETVLDKIVEDAARASPEHSTIEEIIEGLDMRPWL